MTTQTQPECVCGGRGGACMHVCVHIHTRICVCTYMHMHISMKCFCTLVYSTPLSKMHQQLVETYQYLRPQSRNGWVTWPMQLRALHLSHACREPPTTQKCHHQRWNDISLFTIYSPKHSTPFKIVSLTSGSFQCPVLISSLQIVHGQSMCPDANSNSCFYQHSVIPN